MLNVNDELKNVLNHNASHLYGMDVSTFLSLDKTSQRVLMENYWRFLNELKKKQKKVNDIVDKNKILKKVIK